MDNDNILEEVLLNSASTRAFLKRMKTKHPNKWQRIKGNILSAYHDLEPKRVLVKKIQIGVFDPLQNDNWPWHYHYEDGRYLSGKKRVCGLSKAAEFSSKEEARMFFHQWKGNQKYKMELIETESWQDRE